MFAANFDRRPFYLEHSLADHPLMQLPAIAALSERLPPNLREWNRGQPGAFVAPEEVPHHRSCQETILRIGEEPAWVLLLQIEHDPSYRRLIDELLDGIATLSEPLRPGMWQRQSFLFVSARESFTPFHFDPEYNFLLQVRGRKTVHMWDPANRFVLPASQLDEFYAGLGEGDPRYANRRPSFREEFMASAWHLPLVAGKGLHFPVHAPHAVRTESDVSISLSITFRTRRSQSHAMVHGANGHIRRSLGIEPPEPGAYALWDNVANFGYRGVRKVAALVQRRRPVRP